MDLSLARIRRLLSNLPSYTRPTIHVAGTNGKGSVTAFLDAILREAGYSTGRFNSPHLQTVRDAISINGTAVSEASYTSASQLVETANHANGATSFEVLTSTALCIFEREKVDVAIVEVGLGGRLDATNAMPDSVVIASAITAVDFDHQAILGDTIEQIAKEKAAIARKGVVCVVGHQAHPSVESTVREIVEKRGGRFVRASDEVLITLRSETSRKPPTLDSMPKSIYSHPQFLDINLGDEAVQTRLSLQGGHQQSNATTAIAIIKHLRTVPTFGRVTAAHIASGLSKTAWPGRLEWVECNVQGRHMQILADGAHNAASVEALARYLEDIQLPHPRSFVLSLSFTQGKSTLGTLKPLLRKGDRVAVVGFGAVEGMPWVIPVESGDIKSTAEVLGANVSTCLDLVDALSWAGDGSGPIVVCGSLYLIADLYRLANPTRMNDT